jgi:hypothetical protein
MPVITEDYAALASKITAAFTGDPSFFAYNGEEEEPEPEDPDSYIQKYGAQQFLEYKEKNGKKNRSC